MSQTVRAVVLLALVGVLLGTGVLATSQAYQDSPTHVESIDNESLTQKVGEWQSVDAATKDGFAGAYDNETVRNSSGSTLTEGTDYEWNQSDGRIKFLDSSSTNNGSSAEIDYSYDQRSEMAVSMVGPLAAVFDMAGILPIVFVTGLVFAGLRVLWSAVPENSYGRRR